MKTLNDDEVKDLAEMVRSAAKEYAAPIITVNQGLAGIWSSNDVVDDALTTVYNLYGKNSEEARKQALAAGKRMGPQTGATLAKIHAKIVTNTVMPSVPAVGIKPTQSGAAKSQKAQKSVNSLFSEHAKIREAFKGAMYSGMFAPHFGLLYRFDKSKPQYERAWIEALDPKDCGMEPRRGRFLWYTEEVQFGDLDEAWRNKYLESDDRKEPKNYECVIVTRVYHKGLSIGTEEGESDKCPVSIFINPSADRPIEKVFHDPGHYVATDEVIECPMVISHTEEQPPGGAIPDAEVSGWLPIIRMAIEDMNAINTEVGTLSRIRLYNKKTGLNDQTIAAAFQKPINGIVWIGLNAEEYATGVSSQVRPIEKDSNLSELLSVFAHHMNLLSMESGVFPVDFGSAQSPQKSATEAGSIVQGGQARRRERLEIVSLAMSNIFKIHHSYQLEVYGETIDMPNNARIEVPNPETARFNFRVDPVELGHLDLQQDLNANFTWLQTLSNILSRWPQQMPGIVRQALISVAEAMGHHDAADAIGVPAVGETPQDRFIEYLMSPAKGIRTSDQDDPMMFVNFYVDLREQAQADSRMDHVAALNAAISEYEVRIQANEAMNAQATPAPNLPPAVQTPFPAAGGLV